MYAKLMGRITESSLMEEPIVIRYVFMMLLAVADPKGYAIGTDVALARRLNISLQEFKDAVRALMEPDPDSNSKECEGRRVVESDGERGYFVVNYGKYRDTRNEEERREWMREYMRNYRGKSKSVNPVNLGKPCKPPLAKEEEDVDSKAKSDTLPTSPHAQRISALFSRRLTTAWGEREILAYKALVKRGAVTDDALDALEAYYLNERSKGQDGRHRRDLATFLNNFDGELDRANAHQENPNGRNSHPDRNGSKSRNGELNAAAASEYG